ncbi:acyl-CoA dehydrogenase, mitochondrial precursor,putative [Trypanosoma brucei gambiense DAL972]|uniref:Acyl-CoA dehydrogenase, mitochondrial,putative n=2 Tax=Trypanosoma brucei TaxID=5691 RepID=C9ZUR0_TRYB9|nr:acyl-CoA dehydrogenase, mitochondrial precursor,putative [Trypanosoma brucei gambiense DAL972]RHW70968.1 acyl-CoA dehydrogenase [Trypanosoma brucei equiperdum]CBH13148.1 acyl-CoA dehydrogenase, mitochondrial precursor,putative [Trypanosoma brucei gambiense DAL972]|eukprot:XP_011775425.1 acyl-CoA dehydrogenase, mitochondrial precursor,putative [Trypanosoma brucei gambiense DAL972]
MRRFISVSKHMPGRHSSYAAGLFNFKIVPDEMFPYPCRKVDGDEAENLQLLLEDVRKNGSTLTNLYGARISTEYGGMDLGHTAHALIYEEVGAKCNADMLSLIGHSGMCTYLLSAVGDKSLKGEYLTAMSDGSVVMGWAVEESNGSDFSMTSTKASLRDDKYVLTGEKHCFNAAKATHFLVLGKTFTQIVAEEGATTVERLSFFICAKDAPGVKVVGNSVTMENTPARCAVGVVGEGFKNAMITLFTEQYLYTASLLGIMKRILQILGESNAGEGAGGLIGSFACFVYAMESTIYALAAIADTPVEDSLLECTLTAAFTQSTVTKLLKDLEISIPPSVQLEECISCARSILNQTEQDHFLYAAAVCCGIEDYGLFFQNASTLQVMQARLLRSLGVRDRIPIKNVRNASLIDEVVVTFGNAVETTFVRSGSHVQYQQLLLDRLGEAASLIYAASAVASRASLCVAKGLPSLELEESLAACFVSSAVSRSRVLCEEVCNVGKTADDILRRIALDICEDALQ